MSVNPRRARLTALHEVQELHPLLQDLLRQLPNVLRVEYTHGPNEMGADLVVERSHHLFGHSEFVGIVAKAEPIVQNYDDVARQIKECWVPRVIFGGKKRESMSEVWVVTSHHITRNAKEKLQQELCGHAIQVLDWEALADLIDNHLPSFWHQVPIVTGRYLQEVVTEIATQEAQSALLPGADHIYIPIDVYATSDKDSAGVPGRRKSTDIKTEVRRHRLVVLEGGMGSGKSRALRHLLWELCNEENFNDHRWLPLLESCSRFAADYGADLCQLLEARVPAEALAEEPIREPLFLLDALDEADLPAERRREILLSVREQAEELDARVLVTTRPFGALSEADASQQPLRHLELGALTPIKTVKFLTRLCSDLDLESGMLEQIRKSHLFREIERRPISVLLLARILREHPTELPSSLTELYAQFTELVLGRWDMEKGFATQKQYETLSRVIIRLAQFMMTNRVHEIAVDEVLNRFDDYITERNLTGLDAVDLLTYLVERSDLVFLSEDDRILQFKHRTFPEFFYALNLSEQGPVVDIDKSALEPYWRNSIFFLFGLKKDCPELVEEFLELDPSDEAETWMKLSSAGGLLLAAYTTPYQYAARVTAATFQDAAELYSRVKTGEPGFLSQLSPFILASALQGTLQQGFGYPHFKAALESAFDTVPAQFDDAESAAIAAFFIAMALVLVDGGAAFDRLVDEYEGDLPIEFRFALRLAGESQKVHSKLLKRHDRNLRRQLKDTDKAALKKLLLTTSFVELGRQSAASNP